MMKPKKQKKKSKTLVVSKVTINSNSKLPLLISILLFISIIGAITITQISPVGNITTSNSTQLIEINISAPEGIVLNNTIWNWEGVNYTLWNGLAGWWQFNNFSSLGENDTHVYDVSGNGNNGTVVGGSNISWTPNGKYGGAFNFSGGVNYINIPVISTINESLNFSVSGWFYTNSNSGTTSQVLIAQSNPTNHRFQIEIYSNSNQNTLRYGFYNSTEYMCIVYQRNQSLNKSEDLGIGAIDEGLAKLIWRVNNEKG